MLSNLVIYRGPRAMDQKAIMLNIKENVGSPIAGSFGGGIDHHYFSYSKKENWYHIYGRLAKLTGREPGVLVCNDVYEMLMLQAYRIPKKVVQIVHDAYNVQLALLYGDVVDRFICHSFFYYEVLRQFLPHRKSDISFLPYGIPLSKKCRQEAKTGEPLKLMFLGRHDTGKGIFDLIEIEKILEENNVKVHWLIMGRGPKSEQLRQQWSSRHNVIFKSPEQHEAVAAEILHADVFVFPTRFEGFPVALLESMGAGVVPVVTDLPGGIRELVKDGVNGFLCEEGNVSAFAEKIIYLNRNRPQLEDMSRNAFALVNSRYDAVTQSPAYQHFFKEVYELPGAPVHHHVKRKIGSRLDQPWIPNAVSRLLRIYAQ